MKKVMTTVAVLACLLGASASEAGIGISPRLAVPAGDFGDVVGTGLGAALTLDKQVKGRPARLGLVFLNFGDGDLGKATAMGVLAGYRHDFGASDMKPYFKADATLYRVNTKIDLFGFSTDETETKVKITPGLGLRRGPLAAEVDYDLAGDWLGIQVIYTVGG